MSNPYTGGRGVIYVETIGPKGLQWNPVTTITRNANDFITVIVLSDGTRTFTKTLTLNANDRITAISAWVES